MEDATAWGWDRLWPRPHGHRLRGFADHAVGIRRDEPGLVGSAGLEVENAAGKHVRGDDVHLLPLNDTLAVQTQQREARLPLSVTLLAIRHRDRAVPIVIAVDKPFESEIDQRRRIGDELTNGQPVGAGAFLRPQRGRLRANTENTRQEQKRMCCFHEKSIRASW